ncbi:phosphate signaling complex protein PhoU [Kineothrix sp. MB12-C1]|uniref:phosphate signaling complex protein PhoU n=1 Tax=Kineothrix sp. MB12-C1 TaxID=3070215 RepID=UPI0027D26AA6|nr:phosphate signaling complex protein PhoU [Kineothrix sp. MB12-C1]WMC92087.1 phosphate signaling complex protein PhoU [Kineothrix sp. MB12-C1]
MSPRTIFEHELKKLKDDVAAMGLRVEETYEELFLALENRNKEEIVEILESDRIVNEMQRNIESRCLSLIAKQQPVARDLRMITASLKVVTDIERVGDHVSDMAELMLRLDLSPLSSYSNHLEPMMRAAKEMLRSAVNVFVERNEEAAKSVIESDDVVDELFNKVKQDLIEYLKKETKNADECIDVLMMAKYLEKIGDHAVNIAEWELFQETGEIGDIRLL